MMCAKPKKEKYNYGFEVDRSRSDRHELMRDFYKQAGELKELLDKINGKQKEIYTFDELDKFELNIMQNINEKLAVKKIYSTEKRLIFEVRMMRGGEFSLHLHEDCSEINYIEIGNIFERVSNIDYEAGEEFIFIAGQPHELIALKDSYFTVTVLKD